LATATATGAAVSAGKAGTSGQPRQRRRLDLRGKISSNIVRKQYRTPLGVYRIKDELSSLVGSSNFTDAVLVLVAFLIMSTAFNFYPLPLIIAGAIMLFFITLFQPFLGLIIFTLFVFPIFMYQTPVLAWTFLFLTSAMLIYGYMHYRTIIFVYILTSLAFSVFGYFLAIPALIFSVLIIGNKRAVFAVALSFLLIISLSAITDIQNSAYIAYNAADAHSYIGLSGVVAFDSDTNPLPTMANFIPTLSATVSTFLSQPITSQIPAVFGVVARSLGSGTPGFLLQLVILVGAVIAIDWFAVTSRSKRKGAIASMFGIAYPLSYVLLSGYTQYNVPAIIPLVSFVLAPAVLYLLETGGVGIVMALNVKKQDIRMKFGESFEDLAGGDSSQTFDDIGDYEATKKELKDAVMAPIEDKGVSRAYNVKPAKGLLLFGPPGTGKTMMMRALANEIRAGFYYVKAGDMISAFPGESERLISHMFSVARKNAPCILFFDEIDSIALSRENPSMDETHRHALSQLLVEMDGFQKIDDVVIVGATNAPNLIDPAILRPGRFDKLIYMPLPDAVGRKKIVELYLKGLPLSEKVNLNRIVAATERYSGADIKGAIGSVAQMVAQEATSEHKVLEMTEADLMNIIHATKPSTSLSQLDDYRKFKLDYERSNFKDSDGDDGGPKLSLDDVVGLSDAKKAIREAIQIPLLHPELMKKYDIKPINGLLLFGPPGTGKTMLMRAVTGEMRGVTMLELKGSEIADAGIEKATETINIIFNRAKENAPSVVFIDEIDGLLPKREGGSEASVQITSEVLRQLDGIKPVSNVVVIGATNRPDMLDAAILRPGRFDKLLFIKPPSSMSRSEMFRRFLSSAPSDSAINYAHLGNLTKGFTGADIANICREAKTQALEVEVDTGAEGKVSTAMLSEIISRMKPSAPEEVVSQYLSFLSQYGQR